MRIGMTTLCTIPEACEGIRISPENARARARIVFGHLVFLVFYELFQNTLSCFWPVFAVFLTRCNLRAVSLEENAVFLPTFSRWGFGGGEGFGV
jgi:hypothetical protein